MSRFTLSLLAAVALATGCVAHGTGTVGYSATYTATTPDLVYVSPGVQVIADYDEPIFYSDNFYWRHHGGVWYRSSYYNRGWVYARPPHAVISINDPYRYRRYRPAGYVRGSGNARAPYRQPVYRDNRAQPVYRDSRPAPVYRDNRDNRPAPVYRDNRPAPVYRDNRQAPVIRDHRAAPAAREERREERRDARPRGPVVRDNR